MADNKQKYSLSLDVSTTNVGVALWDSAGKLIELKHLELKTAKDIAVEDRYIYKSNLFKEYLIEFRNRIKEDYDAVIDNVFIEAPLSNTPKNINTTAMLLGFNGIACYKIYEIFDIIPKKITVHQSRSIFCPEFIKTTKKRNGEIKNTLSFPKGWKNKEKKEYIRQKVEKLEPQINWFYTRNNTIKDTSYDMSDAYAVGYAGLKVLEII
jgi:hypothetical protein